MTKSIKPFFINVNPPGSKFAKALQKALQNKVQCKVLRTSKEKPGRSFIVTRQPLNKIEQFQAFTGNRINCPRFATNVEGAKSIECKTLFARMLINSTNGRGIVEFDSSSQEYPRAPLYTEYIPKRAEYRVHVFNGEVIDLQQKKKRHGVNGNSRIQNLGNGYVYCRDGVNPPDGITALAINAVNACNYLYGAVDIIYNEKRNQLYVLEVNSRPGVEGTTLERYSEAIIKMFTLERK